MLTANSEDRVLHEVLEDNLHPLLKEVVLLDFYHQRFKHGNINNFWVPNDDIEECLVAGLSLERLDDPAPHLSHEGPKYGLLQGDSLDISLHKFLSKRGIRHESVVECLRCLLNDFWEDKVSDILSCREHGSVISALLDQSFSERLHCGVIEVQDFLALRYYFQHLLIYGFVTERYLLKDIMGVLSNDTRHVQELQADHRVLRCEFLEALDERGIAVEFSLRLEDHPIGLEAHQVPHVSNQGPAVLALLLNDASRDVG